MSAATTIQRAASTLTPAQEAEMQRMDPNGDGIVDEVEKRAFARSTAKLRSSNTKYKKGLGATLALLTLAWIGNAVLMMVIVNLSKDLKVEGVSLKTMNGGSVSTHGQKNVFEVTVTVSGRRLDEQGSGDIPGHSSAVAQVICANVLLAVSSIENGDDESLVKITVGEGQFWEPRMSAASYHLHENSFGIDQLYLDDQRRVPYDVNCEMSKEACEGAPGSLCDAVPVFSDAANVHDEARAIAFEDSFDGDVRRRLRHEIGHKDTEMCMHTAPPAVDWTMWEYSWGCSFEKFTAAELQALHPLQRGFARLALPDLCGGRGEGLTCD
eukprot:scaffold41383_cov63-Phaeocystis_antarctica.AAC.2